MEKTYELKICDVKVNRKEIGKVMSKGDGWGAYKLEGNSLRFMTKTKTKKEAINFLKGVQS